MNTYIDRNNQVHHAWSQMRCEVGRSKPIDHEPHVWDGKYTIYGPYYCEGWPLFVPKHRKDDQ